MDFELSADQRALQDAARALLDDQASPARVREVVTRREPYDRKLWEALVDQGWLAVDVPEDDGGLGLGFVEVAILAEQLGRHNAPAPFLQTVLARSALAGTAWAGPLADGSAIGAVGWAPAAPATPEARAAPAGLETSTVPGTPAAVPEARAASAASEASRVLVTYGPVADVAVVLVGDEVHVADLSASGRPPAEPAMDLTRCVGWLDLESVPTHRLDPSADAGADPAARLLDRAAAAYAAELLGGAGAVLDMATGYAKHRVQFGQPIGAFQAVKHRCADMLVDVEGMYSTAYYAAWCVSVDDPDRSVAASTAKVWCSDAARRVMASGLQVHGGIGFTWDHDLHLYLKRSQLDQVSFGDATVHRERLATLLRARLDAGDPVI